MISKGNLLISDPFLNDPNFTRSVIMICEHNNDGSLGFVLNQPSSIQLEDLGEEFENLEVPVFIGGPVEHNTLHFIHTLGDKVEDSIHLAGNYYWSGNLREVVGFLRLNIIKQNEIRFFLGYSGWGKGQLNKEFKAETWVQIEQYSDDLFSLDAESLWRTVLRNQGGKLRELSNYPIDPRMN